MNGFELSIQIRSQQWMTLISFLATLFCKQITEQNRGAIHDWFVISLKEMKLDSVLSVVPGSFLSGFR